MIDFTKFNTVREFRDYIQETVTWVHTVKDAERYLRSHMPLESYYQDKIKKHLEREYPETSFVWKESAGIYCQQGIPDICFVLEGQYFGFEVKRPILGVTSKIQEATIASIRRAGGIAEVVATPAEVDTIIEKWGNCSKEKI